MFESKPEFRVIEVDKQPELPQMSQDLRDTLIALASHPGFQYLLAKLKTQRSYMENLLVTSPHSDIRQVDRLQSGIYWLNWLATQIERATTVPMTQSSRPAFEQEQAEFEKIAQAIQVIEENN